MDVHPLQIWYNIHNRFGIIPIGPIIIYTYIYLFMCVCVFSSSGGLESKEVRFCQIPVHFSIAQFTNARFRGHEATNPPNQHTPESDAV